MHTTKSIRFESHAPAPTTSDERSLLVVAAALRKAGLERNAQAIERAMAKANSGAPARG